MGFLVFKMCFIVPYIIQGFLLTSSLLFSFVFLFFLLCRKMDTTQIPKEEECPDEFTCPICLEILYKPLVLPCGHSGCFWCIHNAMQGFSFSTCPVCRNKFNVTPSVCAPLFYYLKTMYPKSFAEREKMDKEEEEERGQSSPSPPPPVSFNPSQPSSLFRCQACDKFAENPAVNTCGHLLCSDCCLLEECAVEGCHLKINYVPNVCAALRDHIHENYPGLCSSDPLSSSGGGEVRDNFFKVEGPGVTLSMDGGAVVGFEIDEENFLHFHLGCDMCGMFPLRGSVYQCLDCPDKVGYDLCSSCYELQKDTHTGKFNQTHTKDHRMKKRPFQVTQSHVILATNPHLTVEEILSYCR